MDYQRPTPPGFGTVGPGAILDAANALKAEELGPTSAERVQAKMEHQRFIDSLGRVGREAATMDENPRERFRFGLRALLIFVALCALVSVVAIQQVHIARQRTEIEQLRNQNGKYLSAQETLQQLIRTQRDMLQRHK